MDDAERAPAPPADGPVSVGSPASMGGGIDSIGPQERARLLGRHGRRFVAGATIFQEGAAAIEVFLLHEGRVRLLKHVGVSDRSLALLRPGISSGRARCSSRRRTAPPRSR